jgi:hypothetical protein
MELQGSTDDSKPEFHPELISRRGEAIAWGLALIAGAVWLIFLLLDTPVHPAMKFFTTFFLLSGMVISFGNWMDRRTLIQISPEDIWFENGLRKVQIKWEEIRQVEVIPSRWGKKVRVMGADSHFEFRTLAEIEASDTIQAKMGFAEGERILEHILEKSGLHPVERPGSGYTYARQ